MLAQRLNELDLATCIQRMHLHELLSASVPLPLLRACLHNSLATSGFLDVSAVQLHSDQNASGACGVSCMQRIMAEACMMPFSTLKLCPCAPEPLCLRMHATHASDGQKQGTKKRKRRQTTHAVEGTDAEGGEDRNDFRPILKPMQSVTALDFSAAYSTCGEPVYVRGILAMLPALQAVTLPVFKKDVADHSSGEDSSVDVSEYDGSNPELFVQQLLRPQQLSRPCKFTEDIEALGVSLRGMKALESVVVLLEGSNGYLSSLVSRMVSVASADCATAESAVPSGFALTRLEFRPTGEMYHHPVDGNSHRVWHSTARDVLRAVARLRTLRHLAVPVVPCIRCNPHVVSDVPEYLGQLSGLTALTKLDITYDTSMGPFALIFYAPSNQSVFSFLETLAKTLVPLRSLRVLNFVCPQGQLRPAEYDARLMGPVNKARLEKFKQFVLGLDDVIVRGIDGDALYPFAGVLEGVEAIQNVTIIDKVEQFDGCQFRSREIARSLRNLQFLTELRLHLSHEIPDSCVRGLAESVRCLQHLKTLYLEQAWSSQLNMSP